MFNYRGSIVTVMDDTMSALRRAIDSAGSQVALASGLAAETGRPVRQGHIWAWLHRSNRVPAEYVLPIERLYGVSRHDLRPDLYPLENRTTAPRAAGARA